MVRLSQTSINFCLLSPKLTLDFRLLIRKTFFALLCLKRVDRGLGDFIYFWVKKESLFKQKTICVFTQAQTDHPPLGVPIGRLSLRYFP